MAEQKKIAVIEAKCFPNLFYFFDKARNLPQIRIVGLLAMRRSELIVEVVLYTGIGEITVECFEVFVRAAGPTVQEKKLDARIVADALRPHAKIAFRCSDWNELHTAADVSGHEVLPAPHSERDKSSVPQKWRVVHERGLESVQGGSTRFHAPICFLIRVEPDERFELR